MLSLQVFYVEKNSSFKNHNYLKMVKMDLKNTSLKSLMAIYSLVHNVSTPVK